MTAAYITLANGTVETVIVILHFDNKRIFFFHSGLNFDLYLAAPLFFLVADVNFCRFAGLDVSASFNSQSLRHSESIFLTSAIFA